jgi:hypothetical protein
MPLEKRRGLDDHKGVAPIEEATRSEHRQAGGLRGAAGFYVALLEGRKLLAKSGSGANEETD